MLTRSLAAALFAGFLAGALVLSAQQMTLIPATGFAAASLGIWALFFVPIGFAFDRLARLGARAA